MTSHWNKIKLCKWGIILDKVTYILKKQVYFWKHYILLLYVQATMCILVISYRRSCNPSLSMLWRVRSLTNYATVRSLTNYATVRSLTNYANVRSLTNYATVRSLTKLCHCHLVYVIVHHRKPCICDNVWCVKCQTEK